MTGCRLVITGQTGVCLDDVAEQVALQILKKANVHRPLNDEVSQRIVRVYSVEERIRDEIGGESLAPFLDTFNPAVRKQIWDRNCLDIIKQLEQDKPANAILTFHVEYFRRNQFFSCVNWDLLMKFAPDFFVTLIDDIYDIWERIRVRETKLDSNSHFTLQNILSWRSAIIDSADTLAANLFVDPAIHGVSESDLKGFPQKLRMIFSEPRANFVFAAKNPIEALYNIIFDPNDFLIYASFPITATRNDESCRNDIDNFVNLLREKFTVIDPLTIDELRIDETNKKLLMRWPLNKKKSILKETPITENPLDNMTGGQVVALKESILSQMTNRDYRMIDQCNCVVVYRPTYGGKLSQGCEKEIIYAISTQRPVYIYLDPKDPNEKSAFVGDVFSRTICFDSLAKLVAQLMNVVNTRRKRRSP